MRLLIASDGVKYAADFVSSLRSQGYAVDVVRNGHSVLEMVAANTYDLVILDLSPTKPDGIEVCGRMRQESPELLILVLGNRSKPDECVISLEAGADDYLAKPFDPGELFAHVRALLRRGLRARKPILQTGDLRLDPATMAAWQGENKLELTRKEFGLLHYLMSRPGEVVSQEELLEHVWGEVNDPCTTTVRIHVSTLRRKLGDSGERQRYVETIINGGYRLRSEQEDKRG